MTEFTDPPLTTVRQPTPALGKAVCRPLVGMVGRRARPDGARSLVKPELVVRASAGRAPPVDPDPDPSAPTGNTDAPPRLDPGRGDLPAQPAPAHRRRARSGPRRPHLPRIRDLGVEIVWLMPVHPIGEVNRKGGAGQPVRRAGLPRGEPGVRHRGRPARTSSTTAHGLGLKVILDWVANHTAWDNALVAHAPRVVRPRLEGRLPAHPLVGLGRHHRPRLRPAGPARVHGRGDGVLGARVRRRRLPLRRRRLRAARLLGGRARAAGRDQAGLHARRVGDPRPARARLRRVVRLVVERGDAPDRLRATATSSAARLLRVERAVLAATTRCG